jgi:sialidase-1
MKKELLFNLSKNKAYRKLSMIVGLFLIFGASSYAQSTQVTGTVTNKQGMPLPGVSIVEKGTSKGASTDFDGNYSITTSSDATLIFSFIGMITQEIGVSGKTSINVTLSEIRGLNEEAKIDLFKAGEDGYGLYHIPGITVTAKGTVLAWGEARKHSGGDWDDIDILLRRSTDDGLTWSKARNIVQVDGPKIKNPAALRLQRIDTNSVTYNNPVLIPDRDGTVHMVFCLEYERSFYQRSDDDGITWSQPVEITKTFEVFRQDYDWKVIATGPNHGIQLKNGRLLIPVWLSTGTAGNAHRPSVTATIFSDDGGKTWQASEIAVPCTEEFINPNETVAVQLADGTVMLNVRNESKARRRIIVTSPDGATGWSEPFFQEDLIDPVCMAGLTRYEHKGKSLLLFTNPDVLRGRSNITVRVSEDEGKTWPFSRSIEPGWSAYSDVTVTQSGTILCFYGRSQKPNFAGDRLTVARFTLDWILEDDE